MQIRPLDFVWVAASDGRWHTIEEIAGLLRYPASEIAIIFDFLVNYGFAKSSFGPVRRFQLAESAPSPAEVAVMLRYFREGTKPLG